MALKAFIQGAEGAEISAFREADTEFKLNLMDDLSVPVSLASANYGVIELFANSPGVRDDDADYQFPITPDGTHAAAGFGKFVISDTFNIPRGTYTGYVRHDDGSGVSKTIIAITIVNAGAGYETPPTVGFTPRTGGGGTAAAATALLTGGIKSVAITAGGTGYVQATTGVTVSAPDDPNGVQAVVTATVTSGVITALTVVTAGSGYYTAPSLTITGVGTGATATSKLNGSLRGFTITNNGSGYNLGATISLTGGTFTTLAQAEAQVGYGVTQISQTPFTLVIQ